MSIDREGKKYLSTGEAQILEMRQRGSQQSSKIIAICQVGRKPEECGVMKV